jgi:hypothetical protein
MKYGSLPQNRARKPCCNPRTDQPTRPFSAGVPTNLSSGKVRHDIGGEEFMGLYVVPVAIDQQSDARILVLPDQVDRLGYRPDEAG